MQKNQISCFQFTSVVIDIFDRYDIQNSIKKAERDRRSKSVFTAKNMRGLKDGQYILVSDAIMAVFLLIIILRSSDRKVCSFLLKVSWTTYFS